MKKPHEAATFNPLENPFTYRIRLNTLRYHVLLRRLPAKRLPLSKKLPLPLLQSCRRLSPWAPLSRQRLKAHPPALARSLQLIQC